MKNASKRVGKGKKTGRLPDMEFYKWNTLKHEMKLWQYVCLCCGVGIQCILLVVVFCWVARGAIYMVDFLLGKIFGLSILG